MAMMQLYQICDAVAVPADAAAHYYPLANSEDDCIVGSFSQITFLVDTAGAAAVNTDFAVQVSPDGTNWHDAYIHPIAAAANKWTLAANVNLAAAGGITAALFALSNPAPYVRMVATNNAVNILTITVWAIVNR